MKTKETKNKAEKKEQKTKQKKVNQDIAKFKQKYFDFYDDIKDYTKGREDW